ncbi:MAG: DUF4859 domain-containing protein [Prevotella sp.]|nr:DUF4859 domain-containing protein [Prevotella sp.]
MKRTLLRNLLTAVVCLFGLSAQAQFTGTYEQRVASNYDTAPVEFSLDEVATQLGTSASSLASALDAWVMGTDDMFFLTTPDGLSANYTQGGKGGFWVNADGLPQAWSDETNATLRWYNTLAWDVTAGTLTINIGQFPNQCAATDVFTPKFVLKFNDKEATFDVTIKFLEPLVLPEIPSLKESDLNVVVEKTFDVEQYPRTSYDADTYYLKLDDVIEKLGLPDAAFFTEALGQMVYTTEYDTETIDKKDTLTNVFNATPEPGFWYTDIRVGGKEATGECANAAYSQACYFYVADIAYNAQSDTLSFIVGQEPSKLNGGEEFFTYIYFVYGEKAARLRVNFKALVKEQGNGLEGYTKVGSFVAEVEQEPTSDYTPKVVKPDLDAIAATLGCEVGDIRMRALDSSNSFAGSTANNGGFWFDNDGFVCGWGASAAMFVEPTNAPDGTTNLPDLTSFNVGQYPNVLNVGDERTAHLFFFNGPEGDKYCSYDVHLTVVKPQEISGEFNNVRTMAFGIQAVPLNDYPIEETWSIDLDVLERIVGTTDVKLYGLATDANAEATGSIYSDKYSCDPKPGFWLDADGRVSTWSSSSPVGICYAADGKFQFFQYPGVNNVGDVFKTQLFLVNAATGDMITFNIAVNFVDQIIKADVVGEEYLMLPVSGEEQVVPIDLSKAAAALGVTVDDLMDEANAYLHGMTDASVYGPECNVFDGLNFDLDGFYDLEGNIFLSFEQDGEATNALVFCDEKVADDYYVSGKFCFLIDNKQYVYNVKFVSPAIYTGIKLVDSDSNTQDRMYDLSGRQVVKAKKGLYIMNGKKVVVK